MNFTNFTRALSVLSLHRFAGAAMVTALMGAASSAPAQSFQPLGYPPGGQASVAYGVNADGSVVVGAGAFPTTAHAARWLAGGRVIDLAPDDGLYTTALGVSSDGRWTVGSVGLVSTGFREAAMWGPNGVTLSLGTLTGASPPFSAATAANNDGSVVVGYSIAGGGENHAFRWVSGVGMQDLGTLGGDVSSAHGVSGDGSVVVGLSTLPRPPGEEIPERAFRWSGGSMTQLADLPGVRYSSAHAVSLDGSTAVGSMAFVGDGSPYAVRWHNGVPQILVRGSADGVSADGSVVVGLADGQGGFLWRASTGQFTDLEDYVTSLGVDLSSWNALPPTAISADGKTIVGYSFHNGINEAWKISLSPVARVTNVTTPSGGGSFIATDPITVEVRTIPPQQDLTVRWTVQGRGPADGISGFPTDVVRRTDFSGISTFTFTPSDNDAFAHDRRTTWGRPVRDDPNRNRGRRVPNPPIEFEVIATVELTTGEHLIAKLSESTAPQLTQDSRDRLRQEYYDFRVPVPGRIEVVDTITNTSPYFTYNTGNYSDVQLSSDLPGKYADIVAAYHQRTVNYRYEEAGVIYLGLTTVPADAKVDVSSAYRNPQRNLAVGSTTPTSAHQFGRAFDLKPSAQGTSVSIEIAPTEWRRVPLDRHELFAALHDAAASVPGMRLVICECGAFEAGPVVDPQSGKGDGSCGDSTTVHHDSRIPQRIPRDCTGEDHVHVEW